MKNKNEFFGLAANILAVVLLLAFVVVGLNSIGLYNLPESVERLLGTDDDSVATIPSDEEGIYSLIDGDNVSSSVSYIELDYTNARMILENLVPANSYSQNVEITDYFGSLTKKQNLSVNRNDGLYEITVADEKNVHVKSIKETSYHVVINNATNEEGKDVVLPKGNFDISTECGFVINVDEFLKFSTGLDEASFSKFEDNDGSFIIVSFNSQVEDIAYFQQYTISLDYGIVTKVSCYENEAVVYEMITTGLSY